MRSKNEQQNSGEDPTYRELRLLTEVYSTPQASQRDLSLRLGIALGLTNALLRKLAEKGYVRVTQSSWKRWLYAITPAGFTRKIHLTVGYIHRFVDHYQKVRETLREDLEPLNLNAESRVAIYGTGELSELVYMCLRDTGIEEIDIFTPRDSVDGKFLGMLVRHSASLSPTDYDRVIIASLAGVEVRREELALLGVPREKIVTLLSEATEGNDGV